MIKQALNNDYIKGDLKVSVKTDSESPIGVFDSGVGGISVLRELVKIMPNEDYLYFGDSINAPYGTKEISRIRELTIKNVEKLMEMGTKSIVVACNTATSAAVRVLRKMYPDMPLVLVLTQSFWELERMDILLLFFLQRRNY